MVGLNFTFATAEVMMNFNIIASMLNLCDDIDRIKARQKLEYLSRLNPVFYVMVWKNIFAWATSMLVTDVGDEMCWWQIWDVGDQFNDHIENIYENESAIIIWIQSLS